MSLYYIDAHDNNGDDMSLFVRADDPNQAFDIWKDHDVACGWACCFMGVLSTEPLAKAGVEDLRIFEVPADGPIGPVNWHEMPGVNIVAHVNPV